MRKILILILVTLLPAWLGACSAYRVDIQQGNTLDKEQVDQLQVGMTKQQVKFLLGTPLIQDPFHANRWDYVYSFKPGGGKLSSQHLTLYFDNNSLSRIDSSAFSGYTGVKKPGDSEKSTAGNS
jgi:outer membrane protein assembly factor BamE